MGPREEDNGLLLLGAVGLICGLIAFVPWLLEPIPAMANRASEPATPQAAVASTNMAPARVIVPFTPNTTPGER
jgi:hypothetical protein